MPQMPQMPMPADPGMPPADAAALPGASDMATPEQKQQLFDLMDGIRAQLSELNALQFAHSNQSLQQKNELLKQVYAELQAAGVDLTDPQSVAQFIDALKKRSPDLAKLFEDSMLSLLGAQPPAMPADTGALPGIGGEDMQNPMMGTPPVEMNNEDTGATPAPQG